MEGELMSSKHFVIVTASVTIFILIAVSVVFANFAADIVYGYLDPRVRV